MILSKEEPTSARITADFLRDGKIVIIPTDTIYGFSGKVPETRNALIGVKGRDEGKPFIQLISRPEDLYDYSTIRVNAQLLALWPGAITIIVPVHGGDTVAFRCPGDDWLRGMLAMVGSRVYSTSVNRAGQPALNGMSEIIAEFGSVADLIIDAGDLRDLKPSTIINATGPRYTVLREGSIVVPESALIAPVQ